MSDTILAVDPGRYKSVPCVYTRATREHTFHTLGTTPAELDKLLVHHEVKVADTAGAWTFQQPKRNTDKDDARRLAELEAIGPLPTVALPSPRTAASYVGVDPHAGTLFVSVLDHAGTVRLSKNLPAKPSRS